CDGSGDLFENHGTLWRMNIDDVLLVFARSRGAHGRVKAPGTVHYVRNAARDRRALHVNVPDRQENSDSVAGVTVEEFVHHFEHVPISGRYDYSGRGWN